jgi:hypothetical protein
LAGGGVKGGYGDACFAVGYVVVRR